MGIPVIGPMLAPVAAGVAYAGIMAFSARGGFDIPVGLNPMTQLYERKMVLPQAQADAVRRMAEGGGGGDVNVTIAAHPMPGNYFMVHQTKLVAALKKAHRNFAFQ